MDYKVLYRKYRPTNFDELVGQEHIKKILKNSIINNKIAHAYMFTGPRGTGKTSTAKIFARAINCLNQENGISCGKCENCINFSTSPDVIEIDAASNNGVENIREIIENIGIAPTNSLYKIYIIDEVHMLSTQAWNAFLKTLEEPPSNVIFILATTDIQKVPITVLSRCQRFDFQRIDRNLILENLKSICEQEKIDFEEEPLLEIAYLADGCMRDALSILDQLSKVSEKITIEVVKNNYGTISKEEIETLYVSIIKNDIDLLVNTISLFKKSGIDIKVLIDKILDNFIEKAVTMKKKNISTSAFKQLKKIIESLNLLLSKIGYNSNGYLLLELELISFINDEENQISSREINQIISREIIQVDTKIDVNKMLNKQDNTQIYRMCDEFISIRINNAFVGAAKKNKNDCLNLWKNFYNTIVKEEMNELLLVVKNSLPQVVSEKNILFVSSNESTKIVGNSKLYILESTFNSQNKTNYKMIFITKTEWDDLMSNYSKDKTYEYQDESEYVLLNTNTISLAEDIFGNEKINIE